VSSLFLGKFSWDIFKQIERWIYSHWPPFGTYAYAAALTGLMIVAAMINIYPIVQAGTESKAQEMADYISKEIPREAVIESWEWELDALSSHWEYHHPHQRYLFLAIRQFSHEQRSFDLDYNLFQADPDYLVTGPFSNWTQIYDPELVNVNFTELVEIGAYRLYKRVR
jgi:hypothetical protein